MTERTEESLMLMTSSLERPGMANLIPGEDDLDHCLPLRKAKRACRFHLTHVDRLDAASQYFHHVGGGVERNYDKARGEARPDVVDLGNAKAKAAHNAMPK